MVIQEQPCWLKAVFSFPWKRAWSIISRNLNPFYPRMQAGVVEITPVVLKLRVFNCRKCIFCDYFLLYLNKLESLSLDLCQFAWNWPSGYERKDEKFSDRQMTDNRRSKKFTSSFRSSDVKWTSYILIYFKI